VFEIEGIIELVDGARFVPGGDMELSFVLSPWRRRDRDVVEAGSLYVVIPMDLDLADAWLRVLDPGQGVCFVCTSLIEASPRAQATGRDLDRHPPR
jgi:hypothetical protein